VQHALARGRARAALARERAQRALRQRRAVRALAPPRAFADAPAVARPAPAAPGPARLLLAFAGGVLATLLAVAGVLSALGPGAVEPVAAMAPIAPEVAAAPPPAVAPALPPAPIDVRVNARPWAQIWIDGVDVGPTPLRKALAPGRHRLEALFPNGDRLEREIEVTPERRRFALP
jgi:hypothetical protein